MGKVSSLDVLSNLKLDDMNVDTKLADQYLDTNKAGFYGSWSRHARAESTRDVIDTYGNKIYYTEPGIIMKQIFPLLDDHDCHQLEDSELTEKTKKLAIEIGKATDLFCQLEYLIRRISFEETRLSIKLITQNLLFTGENIQSYSVHDRIIMRDNTPLFMLGCVAQFFLQCDGPLIVASKESAVICYLFTEICHNVGFDNRLLFEVNLDKEIIKYTSVRAVQIYPDVFHGMLPEITGVITEKSDIDSAVEVFLHSGNHPFPLTRIFVQESIYTEFKDIMTFKCALRPDMSKKCDDDYDLKCTHVFEYGTKIFVLDFSGNLDEVKNGPQALILVEAYRTVKEFLSLTNKPPQRLCLSLWSSDFSEANEIALNANVPIVWINNYCNLNGPDEVAQSIFKRINFGLGVDKTFYSEFTIKELKKKQDVWLQRSFTERCDIILKVLKSASLDVGVEIGRVMPFWKINNFIVNENETMVLGFNEPVDNIIGFKQSAWDLSLCVINALVNGNAVAIDTESNNVLKALAGGDIPITFDRSTYDTKHEFKINFRPFNWINQTKVIWANFGTNFAN